jgi:hypothetical protein
MDFHSIRFYKIAAFFQMLNVEVLPQELNKVGIAYIAIVNARHNNIRRNPPVFVLWMRIPYQGSRGSIRTKGSAV